MEKITIFLGLQCCYCESGFFEGMERKRSPKESDYLPKRGNLLQETVCYRLSGTVYEIHISCGRTEPLYDKMAEVIVSSADKEDKIKTAVPL